MKLILDGNSEHQNTHEVKYVFLEKEYNVWLPAT